MRKNDGFSLSFSTPRGRGVEANRRVTCLKLLADPKRAPTAELQAFFSDLKSKLNGKSLDAVDCQVEQDRERIDEILFRRHTGSQNGIGQSTWDDRMKATFVARTGKGSGISVADEIEKRLEAANLLPTRRKIPRSIMNRLLSAEPFRNRLGFTLAKGRFTYSHPGARVEHSNYDDQMASSRRALSLVFPHYGRLTQPFPADVGVHEWQNDYWHLLALHQAAQRVVLVDGDVRAEDLRP